MKANLPSFFLFQQAIDLVRIGRDYDGGYLISQSDIEKTDFLIGLGINDDWSFESDFVKINNVDVKAYDGSVNFKFWIKKVIIETIKNPFSFYALKKLISYNRFFNGHRKHIKKFVGLNSDSDLHCTLNSIFKETKKDNIFLKIDVEGAEYRFLNEIIINENRLSGLAIEFHDCDMHLKEIECFIKDFGLNLVHIHANNCGPIRLEDFLPLVLELTFSKYADTSNSINLPHKLDNPNNKNAAEIELLIDN